MIVSNGKFSAFAEKAKQKDGFLPGFTKDRVRDRFHG